MAIARYRHMPAEIESLKQVLDMRNEEIFKLRNKNIELGKTVGFLALLTVITFQSFFLSKITRPILDKLCRNNYHLHYYHGCQDN